MGYCCDCVSFTSSLLVTASASIVTISNICIRKCIAQDAFIISVNIIAIMSNQCSCGRDLNNNYIPYANAYTSASNSSGDRESAISSASAYNTRSSASSSMGKLSQIANAAAAASQSASAMSSTSVTQTQLTAKVMFGTVGAIKELREKEKSRHSTTRASDRRN